LCQIETCGNGVVEAANSEQCDDGNADDLDGCRTNCQLPRCGDGIRSVAESCDTSGNTAECNFNCSLPLCGDGLVNNQFIPAGATSPEVCDDGNQVAGDGCSPLCQIETCGNGVIEAAAGEQCDDGNSNDGDACRNNCQLPRCGDNLVSNAENCDTGGNTADCNFNCARPQCGDGLVNNHFIPNGATSPEVCDDGNQVDGDGCSALCQIEACGNGVTEAANGEQCDDANTNDLDGCRNNCQLPRCSDGIKSASEFCDTSGNSTNCDFDCTRPQCGDGVINKLYLTARGPEQCDDGGVLAGDGCSDYCQIESCGNGRIDFLNGEQCDDQNDNDFDNCRNNCQMPRCGDGIVSLSEICDTGGNSATCNFNCTVPQCGDRLVNSQYTPPGAPDTEACDLGGNNGTTACSATCQLPW
jgi:cysteine-rich repeat protein